MAATLGRSWILEGRKDRPVFMVHSGSLDLFDNQTKVMLIKAEDFFKHVWLLQLEAFLAACLCGDRGYVAI